MTDVFSIAQGNGFYNPPFPFENALSSVLVADKLPKSTASPCVAILT